MSKQLITLAEFEERLSALCIGGSRAPFPRRHRDRHILYRSVLQTLDVTKNYSEEVLNAALREWLLDVGAGLDIDHVTLRRYLVDETYLFRDPNGTAYGVNLTGKGELDFEPAVTNVDSSAVIQGAKSRAAARKQEQSLRDR